MKVKINDAPLFSLLLLVVYCMLLHFPPTFLIGCTSSLVGILSIQLAVIFMIAADNSDNYAVNHQIFWENSVAIQCKSS